MKNFILWTGLNVAVSIAIVLGLYLVLGAGVVLVFTSAPVAGIVGGFMGYGRFKLSERKRKQLYGN